MLYRRVFTLSNRWFRITWGIGVSIVLIYCVTLFAIFLTSCKPYPINYLWIQPTLCLRSGYKDAGPWIGSFVNAFIDVCILILPIRMVWMLQMNTKRKILVCGLFALGLV